WTLNRVQGDEDDKACGVSYFCSHASSAVYGHVSCFLCLHILSCLLPFLPHNRLKNNRGYATTIVFLTQVRIYYF
ncbi:hypothetical protein, partial [Pseudoalteromonas sp. MMG012]|uniref:hypothetical protein n=1 Tax=Pseudoalteromonas sp. MMG012 TaxID=2822686 RepID=UPI001B3A535B